MFLHEDFYSICFDHMKLKTLLICSTVLCSSIPLQAQLNKGSDKTEAASNQKLNISTASFSGGG